MIFDIFEDVQLYYLYCQVKVYLFKVNNRSTRKRCEIYSKLIKNTKTTSLLESLFKKGQHRRHFVVLLLTLNIHHFFFSVSLVEFGPVVVT